MPRYEVEFFDGKKLTVDSSTADGAKVATRTKRRAEIPADAPASAPEVKIRRVSLVDDEPARHAGSPKGKE